MLTVKLVILPEEANYSLYGEGRELVNLPNYGLQDLLLKAGLSNDTYNSQNDGGPSVVGTLDEMAIALAGVVAGIAKAKKEAIARRTADKIEFVEEEDVG